MPRARLGFAILLCTSLPACVGHGGEQDWTPQQSSPALVEAAALQPRTPAPAIPAGRLVGEYYNVEIAVTDIVRTADAIRTLAIDLGAEVVGSNADAANGSVTIAIEPALAERLAHAVAQLPSTPIRASNSTNDVSLAVGQLQERLAKLELAEAEMDRIMRATPDRATFEAWLVQRELSTRERDGLHNQITSYVQQVRRTQFTVTLRSASDPAVLQPPPGNQGRHVFGEEG
jgi:hypothetical protein